MTRQLRFGGFDFRPDDRRLERDGAAIDLNARYLDALDLLVREPGALVTKDRFMAEVWRGVPVTDEALTQCIRTLRQRLGDDAANPRFIETVPKHGYRFIAAVETGAAAATALAAPLPSPLWRTIQAGVVGGAATGALGGLVYGAILGGAAPGTGAISTIVVLTVLTALLGLIGGGAVTAGLALAGGGGVRAVAGAGAGGFLIGAVARLVGLDAFALLFGRAPGDITGAGEGALLGLAIGLGVLAAERGLAMRWAVVLAAALGAKAGVTASLFGGRLLGGSLAELAAQFPASRLRLDALAGLAGEPGFGPMSAAISAGLEGALFCGGVAYALLRRPGPLAAASPAH
ncbi:MAG: winged helix-turn-helix domain-containing protein [Alphaproteobacteria bacterium]|nr:winged helix-turn-helix domain-containing protein [Alphaproteobacteria bacterium]